MAVDIGMFGPGGEALGGLFTGQNVAQQQQQQAANTQQTLGEIANTAQIARQRELGNQYEEAIQPDKISAYKADVANKAEEAKYQKFERAGQQFGQMGAMLESVPPAARHAVLGQLASQSGVAEDNPLLQHLSTVDPNELPGALQQLSAHTYEQGNEARKNKQVRDAMLLQAQSVSADRLQAAQMAADSRRDVAQMAADARRDTAAMMAESRRAAAGAKAGASIKETPDQAITRLSGIPTSERTVDQQQQLEELKQHVYNKTTVGKTGTTEDIMGVPSPAERAATAAKGGTPSPTKKGTPQISSAEDYAKLPSGTKYMDPQGNIRTKR